MASVWSHEFLSARKLEWMDREASQSGNDRSGALTTETAHYGRGRERVFASDHIAHSPAAGEIVIFDRSWYNRAGVEYVMGFCAKEASDHSRYTGHANSVKIGARATETAHYRT
jgi:hypothetical protein